MTPIPRPVVVLIGGYLATTGWSAVAAGHTGAPVDSGLGLPGVITLVVGTGTLGGAIAAGGYRSAGGLRSSHRISAVVGPLLVVLGVLAAAASLNRHAAVAVGGILLGLVGGGILVRRGDEQTCADATVGTIVLHRLVEGVTLAAAYAAGSAVGAFGAILLAGHATAECVAIAGGDGIGGRRRALGAVVLIQVVFVGGIVVGVLAVDGLPTVPRTGILGIVGGLLSVLGIVETRAHGVAYWHR